MISKRRGRIRLWASMKEPGRGIRGNVLLYRIKGYRSYQYTIPLRCFRSDICPVMHWAARGSPFWLDSLRRGSAFAFSENGILAEVYEISDGVLYAADICSHRATGYPVCHACSETAYGFAFSDTRERVQRWQGVCGLSFGSAGL